MLYKYSTMYACNKYTRYSLCSIIVVRFLFVANARAVGGRREGVPMNECPQFSYDTLVSALHRLICLPKHDGGVNVSSYVHI